jgi:hypothetical protein
MLRSLGIAARVAVGFAPDMNNSTLNFYEIRSLDAHAWVEVFIDSYGWITFDPTSGNIAEDEEYQFPQGNKNERDQYIEEILKNKEKLKDTTEERNTLKISETIFYKLKNSISFIGILILLSSILLFSAFLSIKKSLYLIKFKLSLDKREKVKYLYLYTLGKLNDIGYPLLEIETILEYRERLSSILDLKELTFYYQKAIFNKRELYNIEVSKIELLKTHIDIFFKGISVKQKLHSFFNISRLWRRII